MKIKTLGELEGLVASFENGTIKSDEWRHAEHLEVAYFYLTHHDFETALTKMRDGIFELLKAFGVDTTKDTPYHETLTVFWMKTVNEFKAKNRDKSIEDICSDLTATFDKNYPLRFYTRETLFSERARRRFVEADIAGQQVPQ